MNDGVLVVNFAALQQASEGIEKALRKLDTDLAELASLADKLVGTWDGAAKEAYAVRRAQWEAASRDLQSILRDIKLAVVESANDYQHTEKANTNLFQ
ncbi:MAG TPA: WXG100 family type VII secretion target [Catenuloplanes sp.]|jgi:WXG100 family type VII secretion target